MASVKGVNFTKRTAEPVEKVIASQSHGRLRVQYDSYEASSLASGSDISVAKLQHSLLFNRKTSINLPTNY